MPFQSRVNSAVLVDDITGGQAVVRRGTVASLAATPVTVGGTRQTTIGALADEALAQSRTLHTQVVAARAGLLADPALSEEVEETADATIYTARTNMTVTDRSIVSRNVPELEQYRAKSVRVNQLSANQRTALADYRRQMQGKDAAHPLKGPADQSDQALLDALSQGKGDVVITTKIRVEKLATPATGRYALAPYAIVLPGNEVVAGAPSNGTSQGVASGSVDNVSKFLTGWSLGDSMHASRKFDFGIADVEVGLHAGYTFGLRAPVEIRGTMTPSEIGRTMTVNGYLDQYEVSINDVKAVDGDAQFYRNTGLASDLIADGKELALQADAYAFAKGQVLGDRFNERFPKKPLFDEGRHMRPPYGNCGQGCGLDFYFPCNATKTCIDLLGILRGGAQLGFNVGGTGSVSFDYESLVGDQVVPSKLRGNGGVTARKHRVTHDGRSNTQSTFVTELGDLNSNTRFGYRISNPSYEWNVALTPLIKAEASFDYLVGETELRIGPWFMPVSINVGTIRLPNHAGTQTEALKTDGMVRLVPRTSAGRYGRPPSPPR